MKQPLSGFSRGERPTEGLALAIKCPSQMTRQFYSQLTGQKVPEPTDHKGAY